MNELENYFQTKLSDFKNRRTDDKKLDEKDLIGLLLCELQFGQLLIIKKNFPNMDLKPILERIIYIEVRRSGLNPDSAFEETKRQIEEME
ncbi:hypothetical protein [Tenacibaculum maritimum]|uniref:hypothetical protein n=1 Tax=Tenacibaculum maritimum TaxID=107401 RepID=UPI001E602A2F|nr:hypothetical protein [Tenacibaculum maritimum]MCD9584773.1 hypothetical protein [Tenacibaculum maritimum]MCD9621613.1 hypothetical protein [Tenacibaculum maritimum]MCD9626820.1 hypothetical protein [Tenacibaculum maritimum]MCD9630482.1 hypothetical protein [Tenacibaculum maritimum]MCD9634301.1 hypothetical protein [Tenacibaculum maritimum]